LKIDNKKGRAMGKKRDIARKERLRNKRRR
jgi:hypothetical protein